MDFQLEAPFAPSGDQPEAIEALVKGVKEGMDTQVLLGATGTGKTFTIAQMIQKVQRPTLVIAHNKTLAAQLASEFKAFFPHNAVEYFVSYYDYYQPEAYIPATDTYIEKDSSINDEIDKLRHSATRITMTASFPSVLGKRSIAMPSWKNLSRFVMNEMTWSCSAVLFGPAVMSLKSFLPATTKRASVLSFLVMKWTASWKSMSLQET